MIWSVCKAAASAAARIERDTTTTAVNAGGPVQYFVATQLADA
jgi:hypothetical protein